MTPTYNQLSDDEVRRARAYQKCYEAMTFTHTARVWVDEFAEIPKIQWDTLSVSDNTRSCNHE